MSKFWTNKKPPGHSGTQNVLIVIFSFNVTYDKCICMHCLHWRNTIAICGLKINYFLLFATQCVLLSIFAASRAFHFRHSAFLDDVAKHIEIKTRNIPFDSCLGATSLPPSERLLASKLVEIKCLLGYQQNTWILIFINPYSHPR